MIKHNLSISPFKKNNVRLQSKINVVLRVFGVIIFICGLIFILSFLSNYLRKRTTISVNIDEYYEYTKEHNVDLLFLGSSHSYKAFDPRIIDSELKLNSFNLSSSAQVISQSYYTLVEALKYTKPKMVILESYFINQKDLVKDREYFAFEQLAAFKFSLNKLNYMFDLFNPKDYINALFPSIREHDNWKDEKLIDNNTKYLKYGISSIKNQMIKGFMKDNTKLSEQNIDKYKTLEIPQDKYSIDEGSIKYINKIVQLCDKNDIELLFVKTPYPRVILDKLDYEQIYEKTNNIISSYNKDYIDFNKLYDELNFTNEDFRNEFSDMLNHHLNSKGALIVSKYLVNYIIDNVSDILPTQQEINAWEKNNTLYKYDLNSFLSRLKDNQLAIISVRDEAASNFTDENQDAFNLLGLRKGLKGNYRSSYIGIASSKYKCLLEEVSQDKLVVDFEKGTKLSNFKLPFDLYVSSGGYGHGNISSIKINDQEFSNNIRGINIVIYNLDKNVVEDSVTFDTFLEPY